MTVHIQHPSVERHIVGGIIMTLTCCGIIYSETFAQPWGCREEPREKCGECSLMALAIQAEEQDEDSAPC